MAGALTLALRAAACALALALGGCAALPAGDWPARAERELEAVRQTLAEAHPGPIDDLNPAFREWFEAGYLEARALLPRVDGADAMRALVRRYTSGFRDVHVRCQRDGEGILYLPYIGSDAACYFAYTSFLIK